jgi:hypothetical protein
MGKAREPEEEEIDRFCARRTWRERAVVHDR